LHRCWADSNRASRAHCHRALRGQMATLIRCTLGVECNGKALHAEKKAKILGVEVAEIGSSAPLIRVLGMKREIILAAQDVLQIADSKVGDGRLAFVAKNNLRIVMTKAQPPQLQYLLQPFVVARVMVAAAWVVAYLGGRLCQQTLPVQVPWRKCCSRLRRLAGPCASAPRRLGHRLASRVSRCRMYRKRLWSRSWLTASSQGLP